MNLKRLYLILALCLVLQAVSSPPAHSEPLPAEAQQAMEELIAHAQSNETDGSLVESQIDAIRSVIAEHQKDVDGFLMARPDMLFNFALALDKAGGRHLAAAAYYHAYLLAAPKAGNAAAVKQRIGELEQLHMQSILRRAAVAEKLVSEGLAGGDCAIVDGPYELKCLEYVLAYIDGGRAFAGNREEAQHHLMELIRNNVESLQGTGFDGKDGNAFRIGEITQNLVYRGHSESTRALQEKIPPATWAKFTKYVDAAEWGLRTTLEPFQCDRPVRHWHEVSEENRYPLEEETDGLKGTLVHLSSLGRPEDRMQQGVFIVSYARGANYSVRNWLHYEQTRLSCHP